MTDEQERAYANRLAVLVGLIVIACGVVVSGWIGGWW